MKKQTVLTRDEMKNITGGMEWFGCGSPNVVDCRPNPYGLGYMPLPTHTPECAARYDYMNEAERDLACLGAA